MNRKCNLILDFSQLYKAIKWRLISDSELLEKLCLSLYDVLRPLIIHIIHLETLSELCSILKNEMLEDHVHNNGGLFSSKLLTCYMERYMLCCGFGDWTLIPELLNEYNMHKSCVEV